MLAPGGKLRGANAFYFSDGRDAKTILQSLAMEAIRSLRGERLVPRRSSEAALKKTAKGLPTGVRNELVRGLKGLVDTGEVLVFKLGSGGYFFFREELEVALAKVPRPPAAKAAADDVRYTVTQAYKALSDERGLRNVSIARLVARTGLSADKLHSFLLAECRAHRANPTLGEPTAASPDELAAALLIDGRPHLYVELFAEDRS
jgi:hypothetical protein